MNADTTTGHFEAAILVQHLDEAPPIGDMLASEGFAVSFYSDCEQFLREAQVKPPDLAIVEENLNGRSGVSVLIDLLRISWTTATILISDRDEDSVHEMTEGIGLLGYIKLLGPGQAGRPAENLCRNEV